VLGTALLLAGARHEARRGRRRPGHRRRDRRARRGFAEQIGKTAIKTKDRSGFIVNFLLVPYLMAAVRMYEDGFASREDIDEGMKLGCGHPMGPLTLCDFIGLDVLYSVCDSLYEEFKRDEYAPPPLMKRMVVSGHLGRKTGPGLLRVLGRGAHDDDLLLALAGGSTSRLRAPRPAPQQRAERAVVANGHVGAQTLLAQEVQRGVRPAQRGVHDQQHASRRQVARRLLAEPVEQRAAVGPPSQARSAPSAAPRGSPAGTAGWRRSRRTARRPPRPGGRRAQARTRTAVEARVESRTEHARREMSTAVRGLRAERRDRQHAAAGADVEHARAREAALRRRGRARASSCPTAGGTLPGA
jgi:hypothetical protein